jgi:hypothetical protein
MTEKVKLARCRDGKWHMDPKECPAYQPEIPQVVVQQFTGLTVDWTITRDTFRSVDVIFIDWSEITPENDGYSESQLDRLEEAAEACKRLPDGGPGYLEEMVEFLETFFDPHSGYTIKDDFSKRARKTIKRLKHRMVELTSE